MRSSFRTKATSIESGATFAELVITVVVASIVVLGMVSVMLFGLETMERTAAKKAMQESGSLGLMQMTRLLQNARSVSVAPEQVTVMTDSTTAYLALESDSLVYRTNDRVESLVPLASGDSLIVERDDEHPVFSWEGNTRVVTIRFFVTSTRAAMRESMLFATKVYLRNMRDI